MFQWPPSDHAALVAHVYLLGGDLLATIAVGVGILWEAEAITVSHKLAGRLVLWGVVLETVCSIALFAFDEGISGAQQSTIEAQKSEIITLDTKLVQADANLLNEQRVTARERMRLDRVERAVLPRSSVRRLVEVGGRLEGRPFPACQYRCGRRDRGAKLRLQPDVGVHPSRHYG